MAAEKKAPRRTVTDVIFGLPGHYTVFLSCGHSKSVCRRDSFAQPLPPPKTATCKKCASCVNINPACGVHGLVPCEGAGCTCGVEGRP